MIDSIKIKIHAIRLFLSKLRHKLIHPANYRGHFEIGKKTVLINSSNMTFGDGFSIGTYCKLWCIKNPFREPLLIFGNGVMVGDNCRFLCACKICIGDNTMFGSYVFVTDENHGLELGPNRSYISNPLSMNPVTIGKNVWIGEKAVILPGVSIGDYSVVGAGSIVTKNIPSYSIAVGNPARVIKHFNTTKNIWEKA